MKPSQLRQLKRSPKLARWAPVLNKTRQMQLNGISGNGLSIGRKDRPIPDGGGTGSYHFMPVSSLSVLYTVTLAFYLRLLRTSVD